MALPHEATHRAHCQVSRRAFQALTRLPLQSLGEKLMEQHDQLNQADHSMTHAAKATGADVWINQRTGEIIEAQTLTKEIKGDVDIGFEKLWIGHILEVIEETGNAKIQVLFWLLRNKDQNNMVRATINDIAKKTGAGRATVARLMAALRQADVIRLEYGGRWLINPAIIFKGTHGRRMNVLIRYQSMEQQELPLDNTPQPAQFKQAA